MSVQRLQSEDCELFMGQNQLQMQIFLCKVSTTFLVIVDAKIPVLTYGATFEIFRLSTKTRVSFLVSRMTTNHHRWILGANDSLHKLFHHIHTYTPVNTNFDDDFDYQGFVLGNCCTTIASHRWAYNTVVGTIQITWEDLRCCIEIYIVCQGSHGRIDMTFLGFRYMRRDIYIYKRIMPLWYDATSSNMDMEYWYWRSIVVVTLRFVQHWCNSASFSIYFNVCMEATIFFLDRDIIYEIVVVWNVVDLCTARVTAFPLFRPITHMIWTKQQNVDAAHDRNVRTSSRRVRIQPWCVCV